MRIKVVTVVLLVGLGGLVLNLYAYLHDLFLGRGVITMGIASGSVAVIGAIIALASFVALAFWMPRDAPTRLVEFLAVRRILERGTWIGTPRGAALFAAGILAMAAPLFVVVAFVIYPLVWPIQPITTSTLNMPVVWTQEGHAAIRIPGAGDHTFRLLTIDLTMVFGPQQSLPVRLEVRGDDPDGPTLAVTHTWNPDNAPKQFDLNLSYFSWFHSDAYLVFIQPAGAAQVRLDGLALADYLQVLKTHRTMFYAVVLVVGILVLVLLLPGSAACAAWPGRLAEWFPEHRRKMASYAVAAALAAASVAEAWYVLTTVFLPEFTYCGNEWNEFDLHVAKTGTDLVPFYNYAPGRAMFYALIFDAMAFVGFDPGGTAVNEVGYRIVQFAIALAANVVLFFYLIKLWKRLGLPGPYAFPLIPMAALSLHPELVYTYMSANVYTGLFFPIFIFLWVCTDRLIYEDRSWRSVVLLGLVCTAAYLWRNDLRVVPYAIVFLTLIAMGINRRTLTIAAGTLAVAVFLPLLVMAKNYQAQGQFALHDLSQVSIASPTYIGRGFRENANGFLYDDCYVANLALRTSRDPRVDTEQKFAAARSLYFGYIWDQPVEFMRAVLYRMPLNIYDLHSNDVPACAGAAERVAAVIKFDYKNHIWLLLAVNLIFLPFAYLRAGRSFVFIAFPALYALYVIGTAGSGPGYFVYIFLTLAVTATMGIAAAFHYATGVWSFVNASGPPDDRSPPSDDGMRPYQKVFFVPAALVSLVLLVFAMWQGLANFSTLRLSITPMQDRAIQHTVAEMFEGSVGTQRVRIAWGVKTDTHPMPFNDGHLIEVDGSALVESYAGGQNLFRLVEPATGRIKASFTVPFTAGCFEGYFTKHGKYLYTEHQDAAGKPWLERINLRDLEDRRLIDLEGWVYSPLLIDEERIYYQAAGIRKFYVPVGVPLSRYAGAQSAKSWRFTTVPTSGELAQNDCCLFFGSLQDGLFFAVNKADGSEKWRFTGKTNASIKPHVTGASVIFVDAAGTVYELDADTGTLIREVSLPGSFFADFAYVDGVLYAGSMSGDLFAVDLRQQKILWQVSGHGAVLAEPLVHEGFLYFGSGRWLTKVDAATGKPVWEISLGHVVRDTPLMLDGRILVRTNGYLFALEEE